MDAAWDVIKKLSPQWCDVPCGNRAGCGCADEIERALNVERETCARVALEAYARSDPNRVGVAIADAINARIDNSV
jgi:hypothetical protein